MVISRAGDLSLIGYFQGFLKGNGTTPESDAEPQIHQLPVGIAYFAVESAQGNEFLPVINAAVIGGEKGTVSPLPYNYEK